MILLDILICHYNMHTSYIHVVFQNISCIIISTYKCMHVCMYVYIYIYICVRMCIYTCIYVFI